MAPRKIKKKDDDFGTRAEMKTFYLNELTHSWSERIPTQLAEEVAADYDRVAIKVYKVKDCSQPAINDIYPLKIQTFTLQSPTLVKHLKGILAAESLFLEETAVATFREPFKALFFCCDKIRALQDEAEEHSVLKTHLTLLMDIIDEIFGDVMTRLENMKASGLISYDLAWTYFPRGSTLFCGLQDSTRVLRIIETQEQHYYLTVQCQEIAFDGSRFSWRPTNVTIPSFKGNVPIVSLMNYPLEFHPDQEGVKKRLVERAKKVLEYQCIEYRDYHGVAIFKQGGPEQKHNVSQFSSVTLRK